MKPGIPTKTIAHGRYPVARNIHSASSNMRARELAIPVSAAAWLNPPSQQVAHAMTGTRNYAQHTAAAIGAVGISGLLVTPSLAQAGSMQADPTSPAQSENWSPDVPSSVIAFVAGVLGVISVQKALKYMTKDSEIDDADTAFLKTIANDTRVKSLTDFLYGLEKIPAAIVKLANDPNAPLGAGWFYSSDNPLMWPFLLLTEGGTTPLSEADKDRLLEFAAMPDFIRTPLVALRYSLMFGQLKKNLSKAATVAEERRDFYTAKLYSEMTRAGLTIADFTTSMVASAFMLNGHWDEAMYCLATSHILRGLTGTAQATSGLFGYKDAIKEDAIKAAIAVSKGDIHNSKNPEVLRRAFENMAISAAIISVEGYILAEYLAGLDAELDTKEQVALLKSSAAATMPFALSLLLGTAQSAGSIYGVVKNKMGFSKAKGGKEKTAYALGMFSSVSAAFAAFFYSTPSYFGFGALIRGMTGPFSAKSIAMLNEVDAERKDS
jgi:hypothetical protein